MDIRNYMAAFLTKWSYYDYMIHPNQIQSSNKNNNRCGGQKRGKKLKLKKKVLWNVEKNAKNPVDLGGVSLVVEDSILVFEPPKGATRTRILNSDSAQSLQSSI